MRFLDKNGWPVERVNGRRFLNFFRLLFHTRRIDFGIRCRDCNGFGVFRCDDGFVFDCSSCRGEGRLYGEAARIVMAIDKEMRDEEHTYE
jgi:DnaJ-class molecular chaperone